jgi:transcriptional regulator with XRE-family HTH domain
MTQGELIRKLRKEAGYTLEQAAEVTGYPKTNLWRMETKKGSLSVDDFISLANSYGYSAGDLLNGQKTVAPSNVDLEKLGLVIEFVEQQIQKNSSRPEPSKIRLAVLETFKAEQLRLEGRKDGKFDPSLHESLVRGFIDP